MCALLEAIALLELHLLLLALTVMFQLLLVSHNARLAQLVLHVAVVLLTRHCALQVIIAPQQLVYQVQILTRCTSVPLVHILRKRDW